MQRNKRLRLSRRRRTMRVRKPVRGDASRPRLTVFRSNKHIYAQLIDDEAGRTLCASDSRKVCGSYGGTAKHAGMVGDDIAGKALKLEIKQIRFDRGPCKFHGRVKALAEAARKKGLEF